MDKPSLSPSSLTKQMFGDSSDEECEVLTPAQRVSTAEPAPPTPRDSAATPTEPPPAPADTAAPAVPIIPPAPKYQRLAESINARIGDYMRIVEKKKDFKGKAKISSIKASSP